MKLTKRILACVLAGVMALCMLTACGGGGGGSNGGNTSGGSTGITAGSKEEAVLVAINEIRTEKGKGKVTAVEALNEHVAAHKSFDLSKVTDGGKTYTPFGTVLTFDGISSKTFESTDAIKNIAVEVTGGNYEDLAFYINVNNFDYAGIDVQENSDGTYTIWLQRFYIAN